MLAAIQFDDEPGFRAKEVDDVAAARDLPPPFPTAKPMRAQSVPQTRLGVSVFAPQAPGPHQRKWVLQCPDVGQGGG